MAWGRRDPGAGTEAFATRALVVPFEARNAVGNESNLSPDARATTDLRLVVRTDDGTAAPPQWVTAAVPNWLRIVLHFAGSNHGPSAQLPAEVDVPVRVDASGRILGVDVDLAAAELAAYRAVATTWWKETEAPLADVRNLLTAPRDAVRGVRGIAGTWRRAAAQLREDVRRDGRPEGAPAPAAHDEADREKLRRTTNTVRHRLADQPKQLARVRASALEAGPMMVAAVRTGAMAPGDLESWLTLQVGSGAITEAEAATWRAEATGT